MTNRELYQFVIHLENKFSGKEVTLEQYLRALWQTVTHAKNAEPTIENVVGWLGAAFTLAPPNFDKDWLNLQSNYKRAAETFADWENIILFQIADLRRMSLCGQLKDKERYFGINSPTGSRWYNFDPYSYLECGVRGSLGGYEADEVIVLQQPPKGESADSVVFEITNFSWQDFASILEHGQWYE